MDQIIAEANSFYENEQERRNQISDELKKLDDVIRLLSTHFAKIHTAQPDFASICSQARQMLSSASPIFQELDRLIESKALYYKYNGMWSGRVAQLASFAQLCAWLERDQSNTQPLLINLDELQQMLGVANLQHFSLTLDDYLFAVCTLSPELARLCINSVTRRDFEQPKRIAAFLNDINAAFRQLNLKNDNLRKRFDSIKYDVKKCEDVLYDLTVRGLVQQEAAAPATQQQQQ